MPAHNGWWDRTSTPECDSTEEQAELIAYETNRSSSRNVSGSNDLREKRMAGRAHVGGGTLISVTTDFLWVWGGCAGRIAAEEETHLEFGTRPVNLRP